MSKPTKKELAEALYQFAHFNGSGIRGVVHMKVMQENAKKMLSKLGKGTYDTGTVTDPTAQSGRG